MINLRHGSDRRFPATARNALLDRHARRQTSNKIDIRFFQLFDELPRVGRHRIEKPPLALGEQNVERERRFPRAAESGDHDHLVAWNFDVDVLQVVLTRAMDGDCAIGSRIGERTRLACSVRRLVERFFCSA